MHAKHNEISAACSSVCECLTLRKKQVVVGSWRELARWWQVRVARQGKGFWRETETDGREQRYVSSEVERGVRNCRNKIWMKCVRQWGRCHKSGVWREAKTHRDKTDGDSRMRGDRHFKFWWELSSLISVCLYAGLSLSLPGGIKKPVSHVSCPAYCLPNHYSLTFRQREEAGQWPTIL